MNRKILKASVLILAIAAGTPSIASAEWRCDCTRVRESCSAAVTVEGNWVAVTSSEKACSRVDYFLDGQPFVTVVVDGAGKQDWLARTAKPKVLIQSCQVCQDHVVHADAPPAARAAGGGAEPDATGIPAGPLSPQVRIAPVYPAGAGNVSGHVVVQFQVQPNGLVSSPRVTESKPRGIFDRAAIDAVRRWRYIATAPNAAPRSVSERIEFRPTAPAVAALSSEGAARDGRIAARNWCVKQGDPHDLIGIVDVPLFNACEDPVVVYSCNEGLGSDSGHWICQGGGPQRLALVRPGDERNGLAGAVETRGSAFRYAYVNEQFLARPPNTQLWWIACSVRDLDCHGAATRWQAAVDRKPRSLDPRASSEIAVAASY